MGSLPELRRLGATTPSPPPQARPTYNAPRHSVGATTTMQVRKSSGPRAPLNLEGVSSVQGVVVTGRRRESCASSVGAASVRRLVRTGVIGGGGTLVTPATTTVRAAAVACFARALAAAALIPLQVLQGAHGLWAPGPPLLAGFHASSAVAALSAPALLHLITIRRLLPSTYLILAVFFAAHLYPKVYILVPVYIAAGACWSPLALAHNTLLTGLADGTIRGDGSVNGGPVEIPVRRVLLRRLFRASRAARDIGLSLAALLLPLLPISSDPSNLQFHTPIQQYYRNSTDCVMEYSNGLIAPCKVQIFQVNSSLQNGNNFSWPNMKSNLSQANVTLEVGPPTESEEELEVWREAWCGARACPGQDETVPGAGGAMEGEGAPLAVSLCICCILAALCSLALPHMGSSAGPAPWRATISALSEPRLRLAGPLSFFIGLEQGFLYAHLMQFYIACVSGQPWLALLCVAFLRALVACTLSMLLAHGRRRVVIGVGLMWHACLLLALSLWRAARADRLLPTVMAAAWAGCDAVWELVHNTLIEDPWCGGLSALSLSMRGFGMSLSLLGRWKLCASWSLRALMVALPGVALPLLFAPDR